MTTSAAIQGSASQPPAASHSRETPTPVLVVDDDIALRQLIAAILTDEGYEVTTAHHGRAALEALEGGLTPGLIVLDMRMPEMDGQEFCAELVRRGLTYPVLLMTAGRDEDHPEATARSSASIRKPFDIDEFASVVRQLLEVSSSSPAAS